MFNKLAEKLTGKGIEDCVLQVHAARSNLYDLIDKVKAREDTCNPSFRDKDQVLYGLRKDLDEARVTFAVAEATYEKVKVEQSGLISLVNLLSASMQSGKETNEIETAIASVIGHKLTQDPAPKASQVVQPSTDSVKVEQQSTLAESGEFMVIETRPGSSPGTVRAYCEAEDGTKHAIFAKNGMGQKLNQSIGKKVSVKYRQGDKGLIAYGVEVIG